MNLTKNKYLKIRRGRVNEELTTLKGRFFVYFLIKGDRIVYIGCSSNIQQRIGCHKSGLWVKRWFAYVRIIECRTYSKMIKYEKRWITKFKPTYNGRKKPSGSNLSYEKWQELRDKQIYRGQVYSSDGQLLTP